ncbi:MAG: toll/interleukin-1 receptor domain-containing protein [Pseudomonadota bacterium]|nr:toll/interleukin-1 receptor domain-containing protein [Pseudomonadota bacterium]
MRQCQAVIALLTPSWLASKWCFAELVQARERGKAIFPVEVQPCAAGGVNQPQPEKPTAPRPPTGLAGSLPCPLLHRRRGSPGVLARDVGLDVADALLRLRMRALRLVDLLRAPLERLAQSGAGQPF